MKKLLKFLATAKKQLHYFPKTAMINYKLRNGDTQMRHVPQMRHKRNEVRNFIMGSLRKGDTDEVILSELCHKLGLKIGNAKLHLKKAKAQHAEETRTKVVKSLMTGKDVTILASTPLACDPSKETYWSM